MAEYGPVDCDCGESTTDSEGFLMADWGTIIGGLDAALAQRETVSTSMRFISRGDAAVLERRFIIVSDTLRSIAEGNEIPGAMKAAAKALDVLEGPE